MSFQKTYDKPTADQNDVADGLRLNRRDWPDGRQLSFTVFNMPFENPDGTVGFHTPGDVGEMMQQLNKDMQTRQDGSGGNIGAQKVVGALEQQGAKAEQDALLKKQQDEEKIRTTKLEQETRQQEEHRQEDARIAEASAQKKQQQEDAIAAAKRPEEDARNRQIIGLATGFAGAQALMMVSNSRGGPFAAFMNLLGLEARHKTLLATAEGTMGIVPGTPVPALDPSNPDGPRQILAATPTPGMKA